MFFFILIEKKYFQGMSFMQAKGILKEDPEADILAQEG